MTIVKRDEPPGGREIINAALGRRRQRVRTLSPLGGAAQTGSPLGASAQTGSPLPLYNLGLNDLDAPEFLSRAKLVGWRYPIFGGDIPGLAHLSAAPAEPTYEGLSHGPVSERLLDAARFAEQQLGGTDLRYEARLLQIPALRIVSLWMAGLDDYFIPLSNGRPLEAPPFAILTDLRPTIDAVRPPSGGSAASPLLSPTN